MKVSFKLPQATKGRFIGVLVGITVILAASAITIKSVSTRNQQAANKNATSLAASKLGANGEPYKDQSTAVEQKGNTSSTAATTNSPATATTTVKTTSKYSTSPDPRSTDYSTTPPAANPASFSIDITHAGQVAAGTLISYNATKGEKLNYGGDLILSKYTMNMSLSDPSSCRQDLTISAPDGAVIGIASFPYNKSQQYFVIARDSAMPVEQQTGTSVNMFIQAFSPPIGTYYLQISDGKVGTSGSESWTYNGFITVHVTE